MNELLLNREILRKLSHASTCIFPMLLYYYGKESCLPYFFLCGILFISFDIGRQRNQTLNSIYNYFFSILTRDCEYKRITSASYMCLSIMLVTFIFDARIAIVSLSIMSLSDPCATLFGRYFGHFRIYTKSLEGSIAFFLITSCILIFFSFSYSKVILVSLFCSMVELFSNQIHIDDNFLIPCMASTMLFFLQYI